MTNRDAAQTAALPKSAVWSRLGSDSVLAGRAGSRSLTSGRTDAHKLSSHERGPPQEVSLVGSGRACEEVRETMRKHTKHGSAAGVALAGGVWRCPCRLARRAPCRGGWPPGTGPLRGSRRASRARHGVRPRPETTGWVPERHRTPSGRYSQRGLDRMGGLRTGSCPGGVHPSSGRTTRGWSDGVGPEGTHPVPAEHSNDGHGRRADLRRGSASYRPLEQGVGRRGGVPRGIHPSRPNRRPGLGGVDASSAAIPPRPFAMH